MKILIGTKRTATLASIRRRVGAVTGRMSKEEAQAFLFAHRVYVGGRPNGKIMIGGRIGDPGLKFITGGFSSQTLDSYVLRKLGVKAGIVKKGCA